MKALLNKKNLQLVAAFALGGAFCAGLVVIVGSRAAKKVVEIAPVEVADVLDSVATVLSKASKKTVSVADKLASA